MLLYVCALCVHIRSKYLKFIVKFIMLMLVLGKAHVIIGPMNK